VQVVVAEDGGLWSWGDGGRGALGLGGEERKLIPARVTLPAGERVVIAACGESHGACCTEQGLVYCWGDNVYGQGGHGDTDIRLVPTLIQSFPRHTTILMVSTGRFHTAAVSAQGDLYIWGRGDHGRLGLGAGATKECRLVPTLVDGFGQTRVQMVRRFHLISLPIILCGS